MATPTVVPELDDAIQQAAKLRDQVDHNLLLVVRAARKRGYSYADIGRALDVTRQAAFERFSRRLAALDGED